MRLLLIEDEEKTSTYISRALKESGFIVDISADGAEGLHYALELDYDAIILDVMLPGIVDAPFDVKLLHTVRGMGYVLEVRPE
ncbi:heavy metal response regulator YedW [Escherichia coli]|uniref:Two-component system response regulator n=1 Tax=Escherichia coli TaxID=562 RepID=A0A376PVZ6_ECOLX|nr:response regulator [Escherichia coli]EHX2828860.1 response regulator [Escherichia coli]CAD5692102.1 heavy metal response regulator YedW [Escherichia coli]STH56169.1 two-component system response regulator [Escherichia coli]STH82779.1 two-component system response regulator [Escherichia coli]